MFDSCLSEDTKTRLANNDALLQQLFQSLLNPVKPSEEVDYEIAEFEAIELANVKKITY